MQRANPLTVGDSLSFLVPGWKRRFRPDWPPDVFAASVALLQRSGAYTKVVMGSWPPKGKGEQWVAQIRKIAKRWRKNAGDKAPAPSQVHKWWLDVVKAEKLPVRLISSNNQLVESLLQLCAASDEASAGLGLPTSKADPMEFEALGLLAPDRPGGSTLCKLVDTSRCRVLPKMHTPQNGLTTRSLSHHLALCWTGDLEPSWVQAPNAGFASRLNLLLVPWPFTVRPRQFSDAYEDSGPLRNMTKAFGFFDYEPASSEQLPALLEELLDKSNALTGPIDGVLLPESALTDAEFDRFAPMVLSHAKFFVSGSKGSKTHGFAQNRVRFAVRITEPDEANQQKLVIGEIDPQPKHHRWRLDRGQIVQYGLGGVLNPSVAWWENIEVRTRKLSFVALEDWLSLCVLVCEDLARQDPVAEIVRAIGPNLVIALLMDGPQLGSRWAARYATVLADDPGSSVLTLTSLGMTQLSRPPGKEPSRVIGLWKDAMRPEPVEIRLPEKHQAIVLNLSVQYAEEFTADGRSDGGKSGFPIFAGLHPIAVKDWSG